MTFTSKEPQTLGSNPERIAELEAQVLQLQRELARRQEQFECVRHLVAHDLRAPLRAIDGFSRILNEDFAVQVGEEGRAHLERIHRSVLAMVELLEDALAFLHPMRAAAHRSTVDLSSIAEQVCQRLQQVYPARKVDIVIVRQVVALADEDLCRDLLSHLFDNAWKFTSNREKARIEFGCLPKDMETVYFVKDDGIGFNMQYADKVFQPFQRLHSRSQFPGNGIGLALARRIVSHCGGRMWAEAAVDVGTTVYFTLGSTR